MKNLPENSNLRKPILGILTICIIVLRIASTTTENSSQNYKDDYALDTAKTTWTTDPLRGTRALKNKWPHTKPHVILSYSSKRTITHKMVFDVRKLKFSAINCNSLNMSSATKPAQTRKIYAIVKMKSDIIFLSDIRLSTSTQNTGLSRLTNDFATNPYCSYRLLYNSTMNKRGVGILIKNGISLTDITKISDLEENFLASLLQDPTGNKIIIVSIYGPNTQNPTFFRNLRTAIRSLGDFPVIIGGDWNATFSALPINLNIDCLNMADVPNMRHSTLINDLCRELSVTDPYRYLWPGKIDFTYQPRNTLRKNRSRIDFFLISETLLELVQESTIDPVISSKCFDHKAVHLSFVKKSRTGAKVPAISNRILNDQMLPNVIRQAVIETQLIHAANPVVPNINDPLTAIGRLRQRIRDAGPHPDLLPAEEVTQDTYENYERSVTDINRDLNMFDTRLLENLEKTCNPDVFYDTLLNNIRNEATSYQYFISKKTGK